MAEKKMGLKELLEKGKHTGKVTTKELKLNYGIMNFEKLASYDTNFLDFVSIVPDYCIWLADSCDEKDKAIKLLKFAKECDSDSKKIDALYEKLLNSFRV